MTGRGALPAQLATLRLNTTRQDFARLFLGMFAASFSSFPLTFTRIGQAEAPQGQADVLEVNIEQSWDSFDSCLLRLLMYFSSKYLRRRRDIRSFSCDASEELLTIQ
jgi:hypothetical protein